MTNEDRAARLMRCLGDIDPALPEHAVEDKIKRRRPVFRIAAIAAAVVLVVGMGTVILLLNTGASAGGMGVVPVRDGASSGAPGYLIYYGPVLPLTLAEPDGYITATRQVTMDFATSLDRDRDYPDLMTVTDSFTLTNTSDADRTVRALYPFTGDLGHLADTLPDLTVDGVPAETELRAGGYAGGYEGVWGGTIGGTGGGTYNLDLPDNWEDYRSLLSDGSCLAAALAEDYPELGDIPAIVYSFTDIEGPATDRDAGITNPNVLVEFTKGESMTAMSYGFHGWETQGDDLTFYLSVPEPGTPIYAEDLATPRFIVLLGGDVEGITYEGRGNGSRDSKKVEVSVSTTRTETDLETVLREYARWEYDRRNVGKTGPDFDMFFGLFKLWLTTDGPLSPQPKDRYWGYDISAVSVWNENRVLWLETEITIPAGGSVEVTAVSEKEGSFDPYCARGALQDVCGYDMATRLGSNLSFDGQTAQLLDRGAIEIAAQNFGFDIERGILNVPLTEDGYYLVVRKAVAE